MTENRKLIRQALLGVMLSAFFLYLSLKDVDGDVLKETLFRAELGLMIPFLLFIPIIIWLKGERWRQLLHPLKSIPLRDTIPSIVIGTAVNLIFFGSLGEVARTYLLHKRTDLPKSSIFGSVLFERMIDTIVLLMLAGAAFALSHSIPDEFVASGYVMTGLSLFGLAVVAFMVFDTDRSLYCLESCFFFLSEDRKKQLLGHLERGIHGFHSFAHPKLMAMILINSFFQWILMSAAAYLAMSAVGISVPFYASFVTVAAITFAIVLPSTPAQIGVVEFCYVASLRLYGIPEEKAFAAALLYHIFLYFPVIVWGVWLLKGTGINIMKAARGKQ